MFIPTNVKEDSTDYKKYAWSQIRGEDGTSVYIVSTEVVYIPSDSGNPPSCKLNGDK